jgi:hypothetical protein
VETPALWNHDDSKSWQLDGIASMRMIHSSNERDAPTRDAPILELDATRLCLPFQDGTEDLGNRIWRWPVAYESPGQESDQCSREAAGRISAISFGMYHALVLATGISAYVWWISWVYIDNRTRDNRGRARLLIRDIGAFVLLALSVLFFIIGSRRQ